jgi:hypothetical protein
MGTCLLPAVSCGCPMYMPLACSIMFQTIHAVSLHMQMHTKPFMQWFFKCRCTLLDLCCTNNTSPWSTVLLSTNETWVEAGDTRSC